MWFESWVRAKLKGENAQRSLHKLLSALCDAVLHLGPQFEIMTPAPQLFCVLHQEGDDIGRTELDSCRDFQNKQLTDYIATEDCSRFYSFISSSMKNASCAVQQDDAGLPAALHLHLQDSTTSGSRIPVELFHVYLQDTNGHPGHLLGIREVKDWKRSASAFPTHRTVSASAPLESPHGGLHMLQAFTADAPKSSCSSASSSSSASQISVHERGEISDIAITFDAMSRHLSISSCEVHFSSDESSTSGLPSLLHWMPEQSRSSFRISVEEAVNELLNSSQGSDQSEGIGPCALCSLIVQDVHCHAEGARLVRVQEDLLNEVEQEEEKEEEEDENEPSFPVILQLQGISQLQRSSRKQRRKHRRVGGRSLQRMPLVEERPEDE
eukprot:gnl/TRDRNA2_/TRDRNA2_31989_c0_seq1.p1 gnl/TRDRNA2_/TRDRNA2_31989_c0~~gnl/TRDRNA2_/TRDRNA2_31989_c0_seq1.p1  ORF type:complete len:396 (-),score=43.05 gnl/TRDRNA2_/TRDRNA2_31989_c0_seq1:23-1168(-)